MSECKARGHRRTPFSDFKPEGAHLHPALAKASTPAPPAFSLVEFAPAVMDQGPVGSCEGHGWACAIATHAAAIGDPLGFVPSPNLLYKLALCVERAAFPEGPAEPLSDDGTDGPAVCVAAGNYGLAAMHAPTPDGRYSDCTPESALEEPSLTELLEGDKTRLVGARPITGSQAERVKLCRDLIAAKVPIVTEMFVDTAYERLGPGVVVDHCDPRDPKGGGHCQCLLAYRTRPDGQLEFLQRNSWGPDWADEGSVWITENMIGAASGLYAVEMRRA